MFLYNLGHSISGGHNSEYIDSKSVDSVNVSILKRPVTDHCTVPSVRVTPREREIIRPALLLIIIFLRLGCPTTQQNTSGAFFLLFFNKQVEHIIVLVQLLKKGLVILFIFLWAKEKAGTIAYFLSHLDFHGATATATLPEIELDGIECCTGC